MSRFWTGQVQHWFGLVMVSVVTATEFPLPLNVTMMKYGRFLSVRLSKPRSTQCVYNSVYC